MNLNLPILDALADSTNILIAGAGGGFDVLGGLPIYFTLRDIGKTVHLANYSFCDLIFARELCTPEILLEDLVVGVKPPIEYRVPYLMEGYLSEWFLTALNEDVTVWMFADKGAIPLAQGYRALIEHLAIDALILVDGGVDSLMRGDEVGAGTLVEDSISLAAVRDLEIPVKLLACVGFGTEVEEQVCHYNALENMAALIKAGGFLGSCALTPQMACFQHYEAAGRYIMEQPGHGKSHIHTRVIPAVRGEFGGYRMYASERLITALISPLMGLYWFFQIDTVIEHSLIVDMLVNTHDKQEGFALLRMMRPEKLRPRRQLPY
jgi:hypothetical protein